MAYTKCSRCGNTTETTAFDFEADDGSEISVAICDNCMEKVGYSGIKKFAMKMAKRLDNDGHK